LPITPRGCLLGERNAERLQKYLRLKAQVINADDSSWPDAPEIVETKDEVVTLFTPCGFSSSTAMENHVLCEDLEIIEAPGGSLPLTLKVLKRYGTFRNLGEIKKWEERTQPPTVPLFTKEPNVFSAEYIQPGSAEPGWMFMSPLTGATTTCLRLLRATPSMDNRDISRKFLLTQFEYQAHGFRYNGGGLGGSKHELYINTRS
jgi:hypothetical protein